MKQLITYFPPSNVKRQNCYYYIKQTLKKPNQPKNQKIVSQHSLFSDKNWSKVFMNQWIASTILPTQSEKAQNNYQTNCTLSLSLKNNTRPKKFTNRLTVPEGFYNIHTNFQAPPPHANFAHTLKENRAVEKKLA